jgi:hypothetical protein
MGEGSGPVLEKKSMTESIDGGTGEEHIFWRKEVGSAETSGKAPTRPSTTNTYLLPRKEDPNQETGRDSGADYISSKMESAENSGSAGTERSRRMGTGILRSSSV